MSSVGKLNINSSATEILNACKSDLSILENIVNLMNEKVAKLDKKDQTATNHALKVFEELATKDMIRAQPFLIKILPDVLNACGDKKATPETVANAQAAAKAITDKISPNAVPELLPYLFQALDIKCRWQTRVAALNAITGFGDHAPEQLGYALPLVVPEVSKCVVDLKAEVCAAAEAAMVAVCDVVGNRDIEHLTGDILRSITHPEETEEIMHKLAGVTFVQSVESPALAMVTPLLIKGLNSRSKATVRQSAVIIDNMSRLVDDPLDAAPFMPLLMPVLEKAADMVSDPEARNIAERSVAQLRSLNAQVEEAQSRQQHIEHSRVLEAIKSKISAKGADSYLSHVANLCCSLMTVRKFNKSHWKEIEEHLAVIDKQKAAACIDKLKTECEAMAKPLPGKDEEDDDPALELCNCQFTLAYGTKILLHNTKLRLMRGGKYGLLGGNDSGKTTLMRAIANGSVEGFPDPAEVKTVFVEADILGELSHLSCVDYIMADPALEGIPKDEVLSIMATVGFTPDGKAKPTHPVSSLSGGWRMKLAMARCMLQKAEILLLDEPTNHLDVINVAWVKNYINSLTNVTCIMVSHDSGFLRDCCTSYIQIKNLKLKQFKGTLDDFIKAHPEAQSYFNIKSSKLKFTFPQPGAIEGIKSRSRALMKMAHCYFTYPGNDKPTLYDISIQVSMASRVGCVGENGAGKSTMIKVLTGEVVPQEGDVWMHPNARVAYVAQHAFHHIEAHLEKTPNEYIRWRYETGEDKESLVKVSMAYTPEEEKLQKTPFEWKDPATGKMIKKTIATVAGTRRKAKGGDFEYEVRFLNEAPTADGTYVPHKTLIKQGWEKACKAIDMRIAQSSGLQMRALSSVNVEKHLNDVGLEPEFASHTRMGALSGGQKVKVVLAAALWNEPHILILDEPTNYLDRESLGALAAAIEAYQGGVVIISHHNEFVSTLCTEEWVMDAGHLTTKGQSGWMDRQDDKINDQVNIESIVDATGNTVQVKQKKKLNKREEKAMIKKIKAKIDKGEELDSDEDEFANEKELYN
ncbi:translational elongation factor EF-1 alpha [Boothiomyces sp. JEL0866]|nr:translational elongation factor EF-1 alpha [Boothiomyces sp. JEL0866]